MSPAYPGVPVTPLPCTGTSVRARSPCTFLRPLSCTLERTRDCFIFLVRVLFLAPMQHDRRSSHRAAFPFLGLMATSTAVLGGHTEFGHTGWYAGEFLQGDTREALRGCGGRGCASPASRRVHRPRRAAWRSSTHVCENGGRTVSWNVPF